MCVNRRHNETETFKNPKSGGIKENKPWCMKPLLQSPTPSITASSRVEQSPWETKSMTHTVNQTQKPLHTFSFKAHSCPDVVSAFGWRRGEDFPQNRTLDAHKNSSKYKTNKTRDRETGCTGYCLENYSKFKMIIIFFYLCILSWTSHLQQQPVNKFACRNHRFKGFEMMISVSVE